jgi:hypothetical protein
MIKSCKWKKDAFKGILQPEKGGGSTLVWTEPSRLHNTIATVLLVNFKGPDSLNCKNPVSAFRVKMELLFWGGLYAAKKTHYCTLSAHCAVHVSKVPLPLPNLYPYSVTHLWTYCTMVYTTRLGINYSTTKCTTGTLAHNTIGILHKAFFTWKKYPRWWRNRSSRLSVFVQKPALGRGGGGRSNAPLGPSPHHCPISQLVRGYFIWRRRNRYSPPRCFDMF